MDEYVKNHEQVVRCTNPNPRSKSSVVIPSSPPLGDPILVEKVIPEGMPQGV